MRAPLCLFSLCCLLAVLPPTAAAQDIPWKAGRPLVWEDFKGHLPQKTRFQAETWSRIHYRIHKNDPDSVEFTVTCVFECNKSWKKGRRLSLYLLRHEQDHFDISELYARKMRRWLAQHSTNDPSGWNTPFRMKVRLKSYLRQWHHCEHRYDRQTRHSHRKAEQEQWDRRIADGLNELRDYEVK